MSRRDFEIACSEAAAQSLLRPGRSVFVNANVSLPEHSQIAVVTFDLAQCWASTTPAVYLNGQLVYSKEEWPV